MEKILKSYYCDYCGKRCAHTEFVLPEKGEDNVEWIKDGLGNKIQPIHYPNILSKQVDICPSCQTTIARIVNLMRYVNINADKIEETEEVKEINPIDEYLNNYKEQKLAEFCVQKDKEIASRKEERQKLMEQIAEMRHKTEKYDNIWKSVKDLYAEIKKLSVDDYLELYHFILKDVSGYRDTFYTSAISYGVKV